MGTSGFVWFWLGGKMASFRIPWFGEPKGRRRGRVGGREVDGRECHAGSIVALEKAVVGGKGFVFNEK
jgi:hypothetical protein